MWSSLSAAQMMTKGRTRPQYVSYRVARAHTQSSSRTRRAGQPTRLHRDTCDLFLSKHSIGNALSLSTSLSQAVVSLLTRVGCVQERRLKRIRRSLQQKKRELEEANAELTNERDALRKKAKRASDEKVTMTKKAEATAMELDDTKEALDTTQAALAATRKQLNNAKNYRKTVAGDKQQAESERDAAREELEQLQTLADERLEAYEELEMEMMMMMMTDDVMAKRKRMNSAGGGGGGGDVDEGDELKEMDFFHEGQYDDNMRVAILACMRAGVGKDRIAPLVEAILRALANIKVNRMPAPSTIAKMAAAMSNLTAIQLYDKLTTDPDAVKVFAHDGTTMGGKKYGTARYVWTAGTEENECVSAYHCGCSSCGAAFTSIAQL